MSKVLIVEDDQLVMSNVKDWLESENLNVDTAANAEDAWRFLNLYQYDVVVLDWNLGDDGQSGVDLLKRYRSSGGQAHVLMLTGRNEIQDKEEGLDSGADDYLTKPYDVRELTARIRAFLRRSLSGSSNHALVCGVIRIDSNSRRVFVSEKEIHLQPTEFDVLAFFMRRPNEVLSPEAILSNVWSSDDAPGTDSVYTCIKHLRKKLGATDGADKYIKTVHGVGYVLQEKQS